MTNASHKHQETIRNGFPLSQIAISIGAYHVMEWLGPSTHTIVSEGVILHLPAAAGVVCVINALRVAEWVLNHLAERLALKIALTPNLMKGSASFAKWRDIKQEVPSWGTGSYFGIFPRGFLRRNREIINGSESVVAIWGPSASGKTTRILQPSILSNRYANHYIVDFKADLTHVLYKELAKRGKVIVLDIGQQFADHPTIPSDSFNPLNIIFNNLYRPNGILNIKGDAKELTYQLYSEKSAGTIDPYWPNGSRNVMHTVIIYLVLLMGKDANLGHVEQYIGDKELLKKDMLYAADCVVTSEGVPLKGMPLEQADWAASGIHDAQAVTNFITWFRRKAKALADMLSATDTKMIDSFLSGAALQLGDYAISGRSYRAIATSTFDFDELKEERDDCVNLLMPMDASSPKEQSVLAAMMQWCLFTSIKRHPNKHIEVHCHLDEVGNDGGKVEGLEALMCYARSYSGRLYLYLQNCSAFKETYSDNTLQVLLSESQIKLFLPGTQEPATIQIIEDLLSSETYVEASYNGERTEYGVKGFSYQQQSKPLMDKNQIRTTNDTLLFIRRNKPMKVRRC